MKPDTLVLVQPAIDNAYLTTFLSAVATTWTRQHYAMPHFTQARACRLQGE